jgi:flagellar basal-body rod protein FlgF
MDKMLYVAMSGAKETLRAQASNSHNLANASTTGFRADLAAFMTRSVQGPGFDSRAYATTSTLGFNDQSGAIVSTGRDLDVAINGDGWIAVQAPDGSEAYTRAGDLRIDTTGQLRNGAGHAVLGDDGPLVVPPSTSLMIGTDGSISIVPPGQGPETLATVGRIKLVKPASAELERGTDGLFRLREGAIAPPDATVRVAPGSLESSNVNTAEAMVNMIELARRFDLQVRTMKNADDNAKVAAGLLRVG